MAGTRTTRRHHKSPTRWRQDRPAPAGISATLWQESAFAMTQPSDSQAAQAGALKALAIQHQLTLEAGLSRTRQELIFRLLNRTILLLGYRRAVLFEFGGRKPRLLGVSGEEDVVRTSPLAGCWKRLLGRLANPKEAGILGPDRFAGGETDWDELAEKTGGVSVLWMPIIVDEELVAGLWLERWQGAAWEEPAAGLARSLAVGYGIAWDRLRRRGPVRGALCWLVKGWRPIVALVLLGASLALVRLPLRIVAPCEVIADRPVVVTAPLEGTVATLLIEPGQEVKQGQPLLTYDKSAAADRLEAQRQQVRIIEAEIERARLAAFDDPASRAQVRILEHRLKQEQARLALALANWEKMDVVSPVDGVVMTGDPSQWRGRPVRAGEKILTIVDPDKTLARIWLPQDDRIAFDRSRPVSIFLNADPRTAHPADLEQVASEARPGPGAVPSFPARARWTGTGHGVRIGLRGHAVLHGEDDVSLAYWLFRKPLASVRRALGL